VFTNFWHMITNIHMES